MVLAFEEHDLPTPYHVASLKREELDSIIRTSPTFEGTALLWQATKCWTEGQDLEMGSENPDMANQITTLVRDMKAPTLAETKFASLRDALQQKALLPPNFDNLTPKAKTTAIAQSTADHNDILNFCDLQAKFNILRAVQGSLRSVASGINSYLRYCQSIDANPFPITRATVRRWSSTFKPGKTFANYTNHLKKADLLLGNEPKWCNLEIRTIAKGLINAQDRSFAFPNYIQSVDLFQIISHEVTHSPLARIAYLSYLFSLRVPSETLRLVRAPPGTPLLRFLPQTEKALIGVETFEEIQVSVIKFRFRKNIRGGFILIRPCLCNEKAKRARPLCPVHAWWRLITKVTRVGGAPFPDDLR